MRIFNRLLVLFCVSAICACGVKAAPKASEPFLVPYPADVGLSLSDKGVTIKNENKFYAVAPERSVTPSSPFISYKYEELPKIKSGESFTDGDVVEGVTYTYRLRYFYPDYDLYSAPATRTITYVMPLKLTDVTVTEYANEACVKATLNKKIKFITINIGGRDVATSDNGSVCFKLPNSMTVDFLIVPYNEEGLSGLASQKTLKRDETKVTLPPQNARAIREKNSIILTWDGYHSRKINYLVYLVNEADDSMTLITKTNVTIESYKPADMKKCYKFALMSNIAENTSEAVYVTSCP